MHKIAIGISVYNNSSNVKNLINSIRSLTRFSQHQQNIVVCDDGSDEAIFKNIYQFCSSLEIPCIRNSVNQGVSYSWNRLTEYYDTEYMVILNDDTRVIYRNWLNDIVFALDNNTKIGIVDWRENVIDFNGQLIRQTNSYNGKCPKIKLKPSGPFFAFRKNIWESIIQPDNSVGFWEDLLAYREEMDLAAEFANRGFYTMQLPFYMEHFKSQTFSRNPDSRIRQTYSKFLTEDEFYKEYYVYSQVGIGTREENSNQLHGLKKRLKSIFWNSSRTKLPTKLEYSRAMFAKKWKDKVLFNTNGTDFLNNIKLSQKAFLESLQNIEIVYINDEMNAEKTWL